jgi:hypothetical protein
MRRLASILCAAVLVAAIPRPAYADLGLLRWFDRLSGPGPFTGLFADVNFLCIAKKADASAKSAWAVRVDLDCRTARREAVDRKQKPRVLSIGAQVAALSGPNHLTYAAPLDQAPAPDVRAYPVMGTMTYALHRTLDVGAGIGLVHFTGRGFGFSRFAIEPQATFKPLMLFAPDDRPSALEVLQLRFNVTGLIGQIEAEDFGAVSGLTPKSSEWLKGFTIIVNVGSLLR